MIKLRKKDSSLDFDSIDLIFKVTCLCLLLPIYTSLGVCGVSHF